MKKIIEYYTVIFIALFMLGGCRYINDAQETAYNEFKASSSLVKYEWFKDASASLAQKLESIKVVEAKIQALSDDYEGVPRREWDRTDKETYRIWTQELTGMILSYNILAAEFNSNRSKFNWTYAEGDKPEEVQQYKH